MSQKPSSALRRSVRSPYVYAAFLLLLHLFFIDGYYHESGTPLLTRAGAALFILFPLTPLALCKTRGERVFALCCAAACWLMLPLIQSTSLAYMALFAGPMIACLCAALLLHRRGELTGERLCVLIGVLGAALRIVYVLNTNCMERQYDVSVVGAPYGHFGYIQYFLENNFRAPVFDMDPRDVTQFYHPGLHHFLSAVYVKIHMLLGADLAAAMEKLQALTLFYSAITLIWTYKFFRLLGLRRGALVTAFAVVCFSPLFVMRAGSVNNDTLCTMLMMGTLMFAVKWYRRPTLANCACIALCLGLSMAAKLSGAMTGPGLAVLFIYVFFSGRVPKKKLFGQFALFLLICVPLGFFHPLYSYFTYGMPLTYVQRIDPTGNYMSVTDYSVFERFFTCSIENLKTPFIVYGDGRDYNILLSLCKMALFSEFTVTQEPGLLMLLCRLLVIANGALMILSVPSLVRAQRRGLQNAQERPVALLTGVTYLAILVSFFCFCFEHPVVCTMDARYVLPVLPIGMAAIASDTRLPRMRAAVSAAFCLLSIGQFLLMS